MLAELRPQERPCGPGEGDSMGSRVPAPADPLTKWSLQGPTPAWAPVGQHGGDTVATRGCGAREQCWGGRGTRPERPPLHSGSHLYQSTQPQSERLLDRAAGPAVWGAPDVQGGKRPSLQHPSK